MSTDLARDEEAKGPSAPDDPPATVADLTGRRGWQTPLLIGALVFSLALAGTFAALWIATVDTSAEEVSEYLGDRRPEVERRVSEVATLLLNYDSTNLEEISEQMLQMSTGNFREQYEDIVAGALQQALEKSSSSSRGQIVEGPDVYFQSPSEAVAIMRLSQTTQSADNPGGQSFDYVMKITLVDTKDGGWKADRAEILSQQRVG